jgi:hypothetical protein
LTRIVDRNLLLPAILGCAVVIGGCSSGPQAPQKGTPAFYWQAANETFRAGDYMKTADHLSRITRTDNEYAARARSWQLVLASGMAKGYMELADAFENGARANKANPTPFRRQVSTYRTAANSLALQVAEDVAALRKSAGEEVPLDFPFPTGSPTPSPLAAKAGAGILPQAEEIQTGQKRALERGVLMMACRAAGAPDDVARAQQLFKTSGAKTSRAAFIQAMARALYDNSELYTRQKLDQPDRMRMMLQQALEAAQSLPDSKEKKELAAKIEAALKKAKPLT